MVVPLPKLFTYGSFALNLVPEMMFTRSRAGLVALPSDPVDVTRALSRRINGRLDAAAVRFQGVPGLGKLLCLLACHWGVGWLIAVAGVAAGLSWLVTWSVGLSSAAAAAVATVLTVTLSTHRSVRNGVSLLGATAVALVVAFGVYHLWGIHAWSAIVITIVSLLVGRLMQLGAEGSLQIPATALFVYAMGATLTNEVIVDRMLATLLGIIVGLLLTNFAHTERVEDRLTGQLWELEERIGVLLVDMGEGVSTGSSEVKAERWLVEARTVAVEVRRIENELDALPKGTRNSGALKLHQLRQQHRHVARASEHVNSIARGLFDAARSREMDLLPESIGPLLESTGHFMAPQTPGDTPHLARNLYRDVQVNHRAASQQLKDLDDTGALLLGGAVLTEIDQLVSPAPKTDPPTSAKLGQGRET